MRAKARRRLWGACATLSRSPPPPQHAPRFGEPLFVRLREDPVRADIPLDRASFHRNHAADRPEDGLSRELLWLLAVAKANRTECYGMEAHIVVNGILDGDEADTQAYVDMQEVHHTRILLDVLRCFDIELEIGRPALAARLAVQAMIRLPQRLALPLILCAELVAAVVFRLLLDTGRELFGHLPDLWPRLEALLQQIMIDEAGHVTYCRARLGAVGLAAARALLPAVGASLLSEQREFARLVGAERFRQRLAAFDLATLAEGCGDPPFLLDGSPPSPHPAGG